MSVQLTSTGCVQQQEQRQVAAHHIAFQTLVPYGAPANMLCIATHPCLFLGKSQPKQHPPGPDAARRTHACTTTPGSRNKAAGQQQHQQAMHKDASRPKRLHATTAMKQAAQPPEALLSIGSVPQQATHLHVAAMHIDQKQRLYTSAQWQSSPSWLLHTMLVAV